MKQIFLDVALDFKTYEEYEFTMIALKDLSVSPKYLSNLSEI